MATMQELNATAQAAIERTQEEKRAEIQRYWDETGNICDVLDKWYATKGVYIAGPVHTLEETTEERAVRMTDNMLVKRSHVLSMIEGAMLGACFVVLTIALIAIGGLVG